MFVDLVRRPLFAAFALAAAVLTAGCADTRGGSIPYDRPLAAPDQQNFQTLASLTLWAVLGPHAIEYSDQGVRRPAGWPGARMMP